MKQRAILALLIAAAVLAAALWRPPPAGAPQLYVLGDMEKPTGAEAVRSSPAFWDGRAVTLHGAGNEVVAFQVLLRADTPTSGLGAVAGDLVGPAGARIAATDFAIFLQHYIAADDAGYGWFEPGMAGVLPWRGRLWPDALIPLRDPYSPGREPVAEPFGIDPARHRNQALWVDLFIPKGTPAGDYRGGIALTQAGRPPRALPVRLTVHPFDLPDETHADAFGELYRESGVMFDSGVKFKEQPARDWATYRRYLQLAHAHRMLLAYRADAGPLPRTPAGRPADQSGDRWGPDWSGYTPYVAPVLGGGLFTAAEGYRGPGAGTGPSFFPAPFIERFYGARALREHLAAHGGALDPAWVATLRANAEAFWREAIRAGWTGVRFLAYILDEVDGPRDGEAETPLAPGEAEAFHRAFADVQRALDAGTRAAGGGEGRRIHLLWTSHSDPAQWVGTPADLRPIVSWWAPNGHAMNFKFFAKLKHKANGSKNRIWFYHSGHPAVGNHTINQLGIDMRLWGLLGRRYGVDGGFIWSAMHFAGRWDDPAFNPYAQPSYTAGETRWGNGVLLYPGGRLRQIGMARDIAGPVPSLRMKAWRRGLQDLEYCRLADLAGHGAEVDALLAELIPAAFSEAPPGRMKGRWSHDPADYYRLRRRLAELIAARPAAID